MAKKKENETETKETHKKSSRPRWRFADMFAFCALALAALLFILGPVLRWIFEKTGGENILVTLNTIAQYCLLAAIALPAWYFVRNKRKGWIVFYFVLVIIFIVGTVLGLI